MAWVKGFHIFAPLFKELATKKLHSNTESVLRTLVLTKNEAKTPEFDANTEPVKRTLLLTKSEAKTPEFDANTEPKVNRDRYNMVDAPSGS